MRVKSLTEIVVHLKAQGASIEGPKDLHPKYLGREGYIGCPVKVGQVEKIIWVISIDVVSLGGRVPRADSAEWLTLELVKHGGVMSVDELMKQYLKSFGRNPSGGEPAEVESLSMLAYIADFMGFIESTTAEEVVLPADHPMHDEAMSNRKGVSDARNTEGQPSAVEGEVGGSARGAAGRQEPV